MKKKVIFFSLSGILLFYSCKKNEEQLSNESDQIAGILDITNSSGSFLPKMPDSILNSFRTFYDTDEILIPDIFGTNGTTGNNYEIPNFPTHPKNDGQGNKNSCMAWAAGYFTMTYNYYKKLGTPYTNANTISPDFIYNSLVENRKVECNKGFGFATARDFLIERGACSIDFFPLEKFTNCVSLNKITASQNSNANHFKVTDILCAKGENIDKTMEIFKKLIKADVPVMVGISIDEGLKSLKKSEIYKEHKGKWLIEDDKIKSGHAIVLIGYDDDKLAFRFQNSHGIDWCDMGRGWVSYEYLKNILTEPAGFVLKTGKSNLTEQTGVFFTNFNENICVGAAPNTGVFGGNMSGVNVVNWSGLNIARFTQQNHSRIEYNLNNVIPGYPNQINEEGTFEMTVNIQNAYLYNNYQLENDSIATLFTTDNSGADVNWPGSMRLLASKSGTIQFVINTQKYGNAPDILEAKDTHFKFKQWHRIGISYGSQGMHIMLDGKIVASNINLKQKIANGGGHSLQNDRPTIGEAKSYFPWGNYQYGRGFEGYLYKVRSSANQNDFKLSL